MRLFHLAWNDGRAALVHYTRQERFIPKCIQFCIEMFTKALFKKQIAVFAAERCISSPFQRVKSTACWCECGEGSRRETADAILFLGPTLKNSLIPFIYSWTVFLYLNASEEKVGRGKRREAQHICPIAYIPPTNPLIVTSILSCSPVLKIFQQR